MAMQIRIVGRLLKRDQVLVNGFDQFATFGDKVSQKRRVLVGKITSHYAIPFPRV